MALDPFAAPFVQIVGTDLHTSVEVHPNPLHIDHVWITLDAGQSQRLTVSINTFSRCNHNAGFDPRVRLGLHRDTWELLPPRGVTPIQGYDYAAEESRSNIFYEHYTRETLEEFLLTNARDAILLEAWGSPYYRRRGQPGLHQIHSRRASCAVAEDIRHRDGALRFYFANRTAVLCLFKFCGQP